MIHDPMETFAQKVIRFNTALDFTGTLPDGIRIMNPFREKADILPLASSFYYEYYNDNNPRHIILGINPGRFGSGITGIPFTDPKRLVENCGIPFPGKPAHEPSSEFIYDMIKAYGGPESFYSKFYFNSLCPLGFTSPGKNGGHVNYNYYDSKALTESVTNFIIESVEKQIGFGISTDVCFCMGAGKNFKFLSGLNARHKWFGKIVSLPHPRYIMQYRSKTKKEHIDNYLKVFAKAE